MKSAPSRELSPFERFQSAVKKFLTVPKEEVDRRDAEWRKGRATEKKKPVKA